MNTYNKARIYEATGINLLDPSETYLVLRLTYRHDAPPGLKTMFSIVKRDHNVDDFDTSSPFEMALQFQSIINHYIYNSDKDKIANVVNYLRPLVTSDYAESLKSRVIEIDAQIARLQNERKCTIGEIENAELEMALDAELADKE